MKRLFQLLAIAIPHFASAEIPFTNQHRITPGASIKTIVAKAAHTVPTPRQLAWHRHEFIAFIHFGPNTFTGREWGNGMEDPAVFAPKQVDTDNWCRHLKAAGMKMVVMTFKHHDGYCLWQTRYEPHQSIRKSPFQDGQGDIAKQLSQSCAKFGLKFGVYLSPADLYQIESKVGLYGNLSKYRKSVIPTDPATFKTDPTKLRPGLPGDAPQFEYECDDYNRYMLNQLYEMLTEYGPVHEVWFDGAHPKRKGGQTYTYAAWYDLIRQLAPDACIFGKGPDIRWCGNEAGATRPTEWNVVPLQVDPATHDWPDNTAADIGSREKIARARHLYYRPAETNTSIRHGWFWRNDSEQSVRSPDDVFDIYERSVGGNSVFMLNVPPNTDGVFSKRDTDCLVEVGKRIRATYHTDLAKDARLSAPHLQDGDLTTFWAPKNLIKDALTITLPARTTVNRFLFQEALGVRGQRIEKHALDAWVNGSWSEVATGTTVGYKKILRFPTVTTDRLRLRITASRLEPTVAEISVHYHEQPPLPVTIARGPDGKVRIALKQAGFHGKGAGFKVAGQNIRYTLDGSEPNERSPRYIDPIDLPDGGIIRARSQAGNSLGPVTTTPLGISNAGWSATATSEENFKFGAAMAIDGDPATFWHTRWSGTAPTHPHTLTIDLGTPRKLGGFTYLPRQDRRVPDSMVEAWRAEGSLDGSNWTTLAEGEFGNLLNDPVMRHAPFVKPATIRHFRFTSLRGAQDKPYAGAAEIELDASHPVISLALLLFLIMDPFGNMVAVHSLLSDIPARRHLVIILREAAIATAILLLATYLGGPLLGMIGLQEHSLRLAGGIVLFLIALGMLFPARRLIEENSGDTPLIVPIAMPLIAGPSAISMVILFSEKHPTSTVATAVLIASAASCAILASSRILFGFLGKKGTRALERLMGMLLIMISVQMILDGIDSYLDLRSQGTD